MCSFVYGGSKSKTKQATSTKDESPKPQQSDKLASPASAPPNLNYISSATGIWPGSRPIDLKGMHTNTGIDLMRG
jgi:hypothetical protein